ncbi:B2 bradykinin receptor-like [Hyla sarda]|uniref:B2 bradykinin receptor-like n=1 Tax=Hyla sarda TaxID=327740 RepID=UPI0024C3D78A|nr:B2 bradykinin receptor-like [Hyla sarda]XP_056401924.1 B2 bradykinin receptor-like [Hyla sarda]
MEHQMMSTEPNETLTTLANTTLAPKTGCIDQRNFEWIFTYQPPYMWFIFVLGFIENLFVISIFVLHKSRCTVTEIYLGNMAAADLIFVSSLPFRAIYMSSKYYWPFGGFMCVAIFSLFLLNLYSSIYLLMMVSIERYLALVKPMSVSWLKSPRQAKVNCGIIWMFAVGLCLPNMVFRKVKFNEKSNATVCISDRSSTNWFAATDIIINVLGFLVPLVVTSFCTSQIIHVLRNNSRKLFKKDNKERKAIWLVLSVFLVFIVCWLPLNISTFIYTLHEFKVFLPCMVKSINSIVYNMSIYLVYSNSCINPVIYSMLGNQFRQKVREVFRRLLCKGPDRQRSSIMTDESVH